MSKDYWLEPNNGDVVGYIDPAAKTIYFKRNTDWGQVPCDPPNASAVPSGYRLIRRDET